MVPTYTRLKRLTKWLISKLLPIFINIWIIDVYRISNEYLMNFNLHIRTIFLWKRNSIGVHVEVNHSARNGTHWTPWIVETTHRPWIVDGSENSTSLHAVLQDSRWPTLSTSGMTLACAGTSNCIQMQLFSRIPHSLSACPPLSLYLTSFKRERSILSIVCCYNEA